MRTLLLAVVLLSIVGCGTVKGIGRDTITLGRWMYYGSTNVEHGTWNDAE